MRRNVQEPVVGRISKRDQGDDPVKIALRKVLLIVGYCIFISNVALIARFDVLLASSLGGCHISRRRLPDAPASWHCFHWCNEKMGNGDSLGHSKDGQLRKLCTDDESSIRNDGIGRLIGLMPRPAWSVAGHQRVASDKKSNQEAVSD